METFSALLFLCAGNSPVTGEFPSQRPVTRSFGVLFDLHLNERMSKQSWGWWLETPLRSLWRHCYGPEISPWSIFLIFLYLHLAYVGYHLIMCVVLMTLTHWSRVVYKYVSIATIIGLDNGLSYGWRQAIMWTNAGILLNGTLRTNLSEISIKIYAFSFKKMHLKMSSAKWRPLCLGLNVLNKGMSLLGQPGWSCALNSITLVAHGRHWASCHRPFGCLFNYLFGLTSKKRQNPHYRPFCETRALTPWALVKNEKYTLHISRSCI